MLTRVIFVGDVLLAEESNTSRFACRHLLAWAKGRAQRV